MGIDKNADPGIIGTTIKGEHFLISLTDKDLLHFRWTLDHPERNNVYIMGTTNPFHKKRLHQIIFDRMNHVINDYHEIDHINGDGLDNRRSNLRLATRTQNLANQNGRIHSSKYKGVHWHRENRVWRAQITQNGKRTELGCFNTELNAALAYDAAAIKLFGKFARTNKRIWELRHRISPIESGD